MQQRGILPRSVAQLVCLTLGLVALAFGCRGATTAPIAPLTERLAAMNSPCGGNRLVRDLDASGDGKLEVADVELWAGIAAQAQARAQAEGIALEPAVQYYEGISAGLPAVFALIRADGGAIDVSGVPAARVRELAVEARWLALQTRLAMQVQARPEHTVGGMLAESLPHYTLDEMKPKTLCEALPALDLRAYVQAGLPPTAIFDLDSTIWEGNGIDVFLAALIAKRLLPRENNPGLRTFLKTVKGVNAKAVDSNSVLENAQILYARSVLHTTFPQDERISTKDAFYSIVGLMRGVRVEDAALAARLAVEDGAGELPPWKHRLFADRDGCSMAKIIETLKARGVGVYILSATPDVLVAEAGRLLGLPEEHLLGSVLEVEKGVYTGDVRDNTYAVKDAIARQWLGAPPVLAFGDSPTSDFSMLLEATGAGFMVNPRPAFLARDREEAQARLVELTFSGTQGEVTGAR